MISSAAGVTPDICEAEKSVGGVAISSFSTISLLNPDMFLWTKSFLGNNQIYLIAKTF